MTAETETPAEFNEDRMMDVLDDVGDEREAQHDKFGEQNPPDGTDNGTLSTRRADQARAQCQAAFAKGEGTWTHILVEEVYEALAEVDSTELRKELVQVAAVAVAWVEALDRRLAAPATEGDQS
jgi:NTP pyrophosphatase (non-canonical NTP hydrolase)